MKLYPEAVRLYVAESGSINTDVSEQSFRKIMRRLQHSYLDHHIEDFTSEELVEFCFTRFQGTGPLAPNTVRQRKSYLQSMFKWLTRRKMILVNPALDLEDLVQPKGGNVRIGKWLSKVEVGGIWSAFDESDPVQRRNRLIVLFGIVTGLRVVELEQVTWDKFTPDMWYVRGIVGKGRKPVDVKLSPQLRDELIAWRKLAYIDAKAVFPTVKNRLAKQTSFSGVHYRQFLDWDMPLKGYGLRYAVRGAGERIGVKLNPHDLRRSLAGILLDDGKDLKDIQYALRHSNIATTDNYLKKDPSRGHEATSGLEFTL